MNDCLGSLCLLPPSLDTAWIGATPPPATHELNRHGDAPIELPLPLFWFDPPWYRLALETADALATAVAQQSIAVSALRRDLSATSTSTRFFGRSSSAGIANEPAVSRAPRMLPYRPERYGLTIEDFDDCGIVDVRLSVNRDESGSLVFSQRQIQRWEPTTDAAPVAGGGSVPAATFPPDVESVERLGSKILQLRKLAPQAAVFVSLGPFRLAEEIRQVIAQPGEAGCKPDGIIIRFDQAALSPLQLALQTRRARSLINSMSLPDLPLWVVPGAITPDDAAKLVALGATGVAVDGWCQTLVQQICEPEGNDSDASAGSVVIATDREFAQLCDWVGETLSPLVERFTGLCRSLAPDPNERVGSFDRQWSDALGIPLLGIHT